jgi:CheY-like chemotaxis protein
MNDRPCFDVAVVGLDEQHLRLIEIVFRHIRHNRFRFRLADAHVGAFDILIAGVSDPAGREALARARATRPALPSIAVTGPGEASPVRHALEVGQLVRQLLPILNRLVEIDRLDQIDRGAPRYGRAGPASITEPVAVAPPAIAATPAASRPARPRVLVVDDSATVRAELQAAFVRMGIAIDTAASAGEALERMAGQPVDLALLDVVLPDFDGFRLARQIRSQERWRELPIVVLSSRTSVLDVCRGAAAGCSAYLGKPVTFVDLQRTVATQLGRVLAADALPPQLRPVPA